MRIIERVVIICHVQEDYTGSDDVRASLDGQEMGRVSIKSLGILEGTAADHIERPEGWEVHAGSRLVIEELDALDPNDLLWDHTFTEHDLEQNSVTGGTWASGVYDFGVHLRDAPAQ